MDEYESFFDFLIDILEKYAIFANIHIEQVKWKFKEKLFLRQSLVQVFLHVLLSPGRVRTS
jgi:hypothetical protein